jgi:hypothetical protein
MASHTLTYTINLNGNITKGVLDISGAATQAASKMDKLAGKANKLANIGMAYHFITAAVNKASAAVDKYVKAYNVQMVAERQLEQVMRNTVGATNAEIQSIKDFAAAQQKLGVIGDEVQLAGAKELATYITKTESLKKLLPMMNDMLAHQYGLNASQEQAVQVAQMVGKVLDGQMGALSRAGYRFTEAQEAVLKFGNEEQRVAELTNIVTQYVGGVNSALAATPEGKWKQHQNSVGDLRERIGGLFVAIRGALFPAFEAVSGIVQRLTAFFEENRAKIMQVAEAVGNILSGALNVVGGAIMFVVRNFNTLLVVGGLWLGCIALAEWEFIKFSIAYFTKITLMTKVTKVFTAVSASLKRAFDLLAKHPWIIAITAAIGITVALVGAFRRFNQAQREAQAAVNGVAAKIGVEQRGLNQLFEAMKKTNPESEKRKQLIDQINERYPGLLKNQDLMKAGLDKITEAQDRANKSLAQNLFLQELKEKEEDAMGKINAAQKKLWDELWSKGYSEGQINTAIDIVMGQVDAVEKRGNKSSTRNAFLEHAFIGKEMYEGGRIKKLSAKSEMSELLNVAIVNQKTVDALKRFGAGRLGITEDLISSVNTPLASSGNPGGSINAANEAIVTGGTRNTTVNISLGNMIENVIFNGATKENMNEIERNFSEALARVLGVAETAIAA